MKKRICAITMVRNDDFFLRKWVDYYGSELGKSNLYIYLDGKDQQVPEWCAGTTVVACDKIKGKVVQAEKERLRFLSGRAAELLEIYDLVIGTDADEFIVPDPALGISLSGYLDNTDVKTSISPLGIDVGQHMATEGNIDETQPFLSQRKYGLLSTRYTKASIISRPLIWGSGFHRIKGHDFHIAKDLYLFHFGYFDMKRIQDRFNDKDRAAAGWKRHIAKRTRTINLVSGKKARNWEKWTFMARVIQQMARPPYALNKPGMLEMKIVVRIPDRFSKIV